MIKINNFFIIGLICSVFSLKILFTSEEGKEPQHFPNLIFIINNNLCENKCLHIHHWIWIGILFLMMRE